jgi:glycerophosphoryl diester phosphodiesterase
MPAFGAAIALGAEEIEFDIWKTKDDVLVSCHDRSLERVSDGYGRIDELTYEELLKFDFGAKRGKGFAGLKIPTFEEVLQKFSGRAIMNIHVKIWDIKDQDDKLEEIIALVRKYDCQRHCYFMTSNDAILARIRKIAPEISVCVGWDGDKENMLSMVDRALAIGAQKVQLFKPYFNQETVDYAHANGIYCNVFWSDDPEEARRYRKMGIDTILTNDYLAIKNALDNN